MLEKRFFIIHTVAVEFLKYKRDSCVSVFVYWKNKTKFNAVSIISARVDYKPGFSLSGLIAICWKLFCGRPFGFWEMCKNFFVQANKQDSFSHKSAAKIFFPKRIFFCLSRILFFNCTLDDFISFLSAVAGLFF